MERGIQPIGRPGAGHTFLVVTLRDLENRALAVATERRSGRGGPGRLADLFRRGEDPRAHAAASLLLMGRESFEALKQRNPDVHSAALGFAELLLSTAPRGIEPGLLRNRERGGKDHPPFAVKYPGAIDMSATRRLSTPTTRHAPSTTAPIGHVLDTCRPVVVRRST